MFDGGAPPRLPANAIERPERRPEREPPLQRAAALALGWAARPLLARPLALRLALPRLAAEERRLEPLGAAAFAARAAEIRARLRRPGAGRGDRLAALALAREAARRAVGQRPREVQLLGALAMLRGRIAEMATGEGKTLAATLPAAALGLSGVPVHLLTVNDYLARRDAEAMGPVYRLLGLTVGCVVAGMAPEERRREYACDVVHATAKEVAFDWLRDGLSVPPGLAGLGLHAARLAGRPAAGAPVLRGLHAAILDEADSVLLDEARTPLVIAGAAAGEGEFDAAAQILALDLAARLREGRDWRMRREERRVEITPAGEGRIAELAAGRGGLGGAWAARPFRHEMLRQALTALHLLRRDAEYLVRDGRVEIVDEATGRAMPDRRWERGLHQMVERKEGCAASAPNDTLASTTYQSFFRRYHLLCGMTGTARDGAAEIWATYRLPVTRIPRHRPLRRRALGVRVSRDAAGKWGEVASRVARVAEGEGRPVLVGTRTVAASEAVAAALAARGLPFALLNARQDAGEAALVARAGEAGRVTIATNMAGRGTDILLGPGVAARGGLHVVLTELHDSRRVDRQLLGRCARQGDPGTTEMVLSLADPILAEQAPRLAAALRRLPEGWVRARLALAAMRLFQRALGRRHAEQRRQLLKAEEQEAESLAFTRR